MRTTLLLSAVLLLASSFSSARNLSKSRLTSPVEQLYKVGPNDLRPYFLHGRQPDEKMLHTLIGTFAQGEGYGDLPRGNYIVVKAVDGRLQYRSHTVDDLQFMVINMERVMLLLHDSLGRTITGARVQCGTRTLRYDPATECYTAPRVGDERVAEIEHDGVYHYIEFGRYSHRHNDWFSQTWRRTKYRAARIFRPGSWSRSKQKYNGFIAFSKPRYKPGETVRMKAYIADNRGHAYDRDVEVRLSGGRNPSLDTLLTVLRPYRAGMYAWEFRLSDSLRMQLDNDYRVTLKTRGERTNDIRERFRYEQYELKNIKFSVTASPKEYGAGDTLRLKMDLTDQNGLPVRDGRVEVSVKALSDNWTKLFAPSVFMPDTLWRHTAQVASLDDNELIVPDSIFPGGVSTSIRIESVYLSPDNERLTQTTALFRDGRPCRLDFALDKGMLTVRLLRGGQSVPCSARITGWDNEVNECVRQTVQLPATFAVPWYISDYDVSTDLAEDSFDLSSAKRDMLFCNLQRDGDSIYMSVDNPAGLPLRYVLKRGEKIVDQGNATTLDKVVKARPGQGYALEVAYPFAGEPHVINAYAPEVNQNVTLQVSTPTAVYPGQTVPVEIAVADKRGKPVGNADVTAWAVTSKFDDRMPGPRLYGKTRSAAFKNVNYWADPEGMNANAYMEWDTWRTRLGLDSVEYYKFLHPAPYYASSEPACGQITQIAPFAVLDGKLQGVHVLWIDGQPYYLHQAGRLDPYSFPVSPGPHKIRMRTADREITVDKVWADEGCKTIVSVECGRNAVTHYLKGGHEFRVEIEAGKVRRKEASRLGEEQIAALSPYMITIDNGFGTLKMNGGKSMALPGYLLGGGMCRSLGDAEPLYRHYRRPAEPARVLAGPFPGTAGVGLKRVVALMADTMAVNRFEAEGGYHYTVRPGYVKLQKWETSPIGKRIAPYSPTLYAGQQVADSRGIHAAFNARILSQMRQWQGVMAPYPFDPDINCRLQLMTGKMADGKSKVEPAVIALSVSGDTTRYLYYGGTRLFNRLHPGTASVILVFADTTSVELSAALRPGGCAYLRADSLSPQSDPERGRAILSLASRHMHREYPRNPLDGYTSAKSQVTAGSNALNPFNALNKICTGTVLDENGEPMTGATVVVKGTTTGTVTDINGRFQLKVPDQGELQFTFIGYDMTVAELVPGYDYSVRLQPSSNMLEEVVTVGYGTIRRNALTGDISSMLAGRMAGVSVSEGEGWLTGANIRIRGVSSIRSHAASSVNEINTPLYIVDGLPYSGDISGLSTADILSMEILKDASAIAIYGARGANGVIVIQTRRGIKPMVAGGEDPAPEGLQQLRRNFHDDAFWQPRLSTGRDGKVRFDVTYPDDITAWRANFIAIGPRKKQTDQQQLTVSSFKNLTAQLYVPQFAVQGDSLDLVGRLVNHGADTVAVRRTIDTGGALLQRDIALYRTHADTIPVTATATDSLRIAYSLLRDNGYGDGERRTIPIYPQGILETHGQFMVIGDTLPHRFETLPGLGTATVHLESNGLETLLREIDKVDRYPYMCNEQMASKVIALLARKQICQLQGIKFTDDGKLRDLIGRLERNRNDEGLWGWWDRGKSESWISLQVVLALTRARDAGYKADAAAARPSDETLLTRLEEQFSRADDRDPYAKRRLVDGVTLLHTLGVQTDYASLLARVDRLADRDLNDRLMMMEALAATGQKVDTAALMKHSHKSMLGGLYWVDSKEGKSFTPWSNNTVLTLRAYRILEALGGHEERLTAIRTYFFEVRGEGSWRNTYESSLIVSTLLPAMLRESGGRAAPLTAKVDGRRIDKLPYTATVGAGNPVTVEKTGPQPLFATVYQQTWNPEPKAASNGFKISTVFHENGKTTATLHAGKVTEMIVTVTAEGEARYVQIEVPIPAGCSYESKENPYRGNTYREYFKEKVSIFCEELSEGGHTFTVRLLPRYTGRYHLNPARAELMYFPTFYGRNQMQVTRIE